MDWLIFILSVIEAIAWPVALVATVVFLRQEWVDIIGRIQGVKHKETQIEFGDRLQEASEKAKSCLPDTGDLAAKGFSNRLAFAGHSPRGAILESWIDVEAALEELGARYGLPEEGLKSSDIHMLKLRLGNDYTLGKSAFGLLQSLREIRNEAFHLTDKVIKSDAAKEYVSLANRMVTVLKDA